MAGSKPRIVITAGDPNGIGPEIVLKAIAHERVRDICSPQVVGNPDAIRHCATLCALTSPDESMIVAAGDAPASGWRTGEIDAVAGRAAFESLVAAHRLLADRRADALVTAPWSKEALHLAGAPHGGHTEALAALTGSSNPITLFVCGKLRIAFLTRHLSLSDAIVAITRERVSSFVERLASELTTTIGIARPRIAVAALNPHGGEGGLLGREEIDEIAPAVVAALDSGLNVVGPIPADAVFHEGAEGVHDCVVALYHDQGHIASKTRDFFGTVSLTLGLPYIRTSPDHGTAFDIAGRNKADPESLIRAVELAVELCWKGN